MGGSKQRHILSGLRLVRSVYLDPIARTSSCACERNQCTWSSNTSLEYLVWPRNDSRSVLNLTWGDLCFNESQRRTSNIMTRNIKHTFQSRTTFQVFFFHPEAICLSSPIKPPSVSHTRFPCLCKVYHIFCTNLRSQQINIRCKGRPPRMKGPKSKEDPRAGDARKNH